MRRVAFRTVLEEVLGIAGYPYDTANQNQLDQAARFITRHVRYAWEWGPWPEWTRAEQRAFAADYYNSVTYGIGDVVYYATTGKYYTATQITQGNLPTDTGNWTETTSYTKEIRFEQAYARKMGLVYAVSKYNPYQKFKGSNYTYAHMLTSLGVYVPDAGEATVWVLFSDRPPVFSAKAHSTTASYSDEDVIYYPESETSGIFPNRGECYRSVTDSLGAQTWVIVEFPMVLQGYVVNKAAADMLRHYGQRELAAGYDAEAERLLLVEWDKVNTEAYQKVIGNYP